MFKKICQSILLHKAIGDHEGAQALLDMLPEFNHDEPREPYSIRLGNIDNSSNVVELVQPEPISNAASA